MKTWTGKLAVMSLLAVGLAACDEGVTNSKAIDEEALRADVALVAADAMFQDLSHMADPAVWAGGAAGPEAAVQVEGSTSFSRTVTFYDASGAEQDRYDPLTTAKMVIVTDLTRSVEHTFWSANLQRHREMTVTGLEGEETQRTWNGTANASKFRSRHPEDGVERTYDMTSDATFEDIVRGVPRSQNPYPLSGTITRHIHVVVMENGEVIGERDLTTVITFNGTQFATINVDGETWTVDLATRGVRQRFNRHNG